MSVKDQILESVGFLPKDAFGWLYVARGYYKLEKYQWTIECLSHCLRYDKTAKESQHLLAFSLLHTQQFKEAASAFMQSIKMGNESDWQPLIELCIDDPSLNFVADSI